MDLNTVRALGDRLREEVHRVVVGQDATFDLMLVSLLCEGHVLLEGVPGTAKTLLARSFAASLSLAFNRIQFTPDLMPGDVIGTNLFNFQTNQFVLTQGPVFTDLLLADEINRTPPKTQAALLQAMQERSVSIDGKTYPLSPTFMVIATQNPIEQEGTYPLPEAQLDRFLFKVLVSYPSRDEERAIVARHGHRTAMPRLEEFQMRPVIDRGGLVQVRQFIQGITLREEIVDYIVDLVRATRERPALLHGASPRCATMLATAARAHAALAGREYVIPDDVKSLALPALRHRVVLAPGAEIEGMTTDAVIRQLLEQVPAPR
ncbi:MAG TPA: MoxR family ATPase [Kofleriaceae bacterium]|nr:MoxR family ATPase [Kofleriaceae bacterium]